MENSASTGVQVSHYRLMGGLAMTGGVLYAISGLFVDEAAATTPPWLSLIGVIWALGCLCGLVGIGILGAVGRGLFGRIALAIAVLAYAVAALDGLLSAVGIFTVDTSPLFGISRLGTLVGMLLVGIAALVARRWPGWRTFSPFAVPLAVPVASGVFLVAGDSVIQVPLFIGLAWLLIGYAVLSTPEPV